MPDYFILSFLRIIDFAFQTILSYISSSMIGLFTVKILGVKCLLFFFGMCPR